MVTPPGPSKSREELRKKWELEKARKAGLAPAEVDEDGKEINPHIPEYILSAPWYLNAEKPSLKHQRKRKQDLSCTKSCSGRAVKIYQADKYRKGACENCGAMNCNVKSCTERPRKVGAKWTCKDIAPDVKIEHSELDYDAKRDSWNSYDPAQYVARNEARVKYIEGDEGDGTSNDEAKVDESKQVDFAKVKKRVRTTAGGSTGTVRNLRIREDTAKYLLNLDVNSAYYDPKTRSMREDPLPDADPNDKYYVGHDRVSGQASEFKLLNVHAKEAFDKGQDIHLQAAPSQAELVYKNVLINKRKLASQFEDTIRDKYGNAATMEELPQELHLRYLQ